MAPSPPPIRHKPSWHPCHSTTAHLPNNGKHRPCQQPPPTPVHVLSHQTQPAPYLDTLPCPALPLGLPCSALSCGLPSLLPSVHSTQSQSPWGHHLTSKPQWPRPVHPSPLPITTRHDPGLHPHPATLHAWHTSFSAKLSHERI